MKRLPLIVAALFSAQSALAAPGGLLKTLPRGYWACETAGDASTPGQKLPRDSFHVFADSSYRPNAGGAGTYLLLGTELVMTSGPFNGRRYTLVGAGTLHPLDAQGNRSTNRCVRQGSAGLGDAAP